MGLAAAVFSSRYKEGKTGWLDGFAQVCGEEQEETRLCWAWPGSRTDRFFLPGGHRFWEKYFYV